MNEMITTDYNLIETKIEICDHNLQNKLVQNDIVKKEDFSSEYLNFQLSSNDFHVEEIKKEPLDLNLQDDLPDPNLHPHIKHLHMRPFYEKLEEYYNVKPTKKPFSKEQITTIIDELLTAKSVNSTKTRREYFLLKTYDVIETADGESKFLVKKKKKESVGGLIYIVPYEEIFEKLFEFHLATGHGSRDKMTHALGNKYQIPRPCIEIFLTFCETCQKKKSKTPLKIVEKPITSKDFMSHGQVNLMDFQSIPDGEFKWILNYQDYATKFLWLRPLKTGTVKEVAMELLKIFLTFGAPQILESDNGTFCNRVIEELTSLWPQLHLVNGRPSHSESEKQSSQDITNMLRAWMIDNKSTSWALGCNFVQWQKNCSFHNVLGDTPYKVVFGATPKIGLESSNLPPNVIPSPVIEDDLEDALSSMKENNTIEAMSSNKY